MQKEFYGSRSEFNFQLMIRFRHDVLHKLRYLFFFWMFIHVENEYACCKKTCLPSFLKLMDGVFCRKLEFLVWTEQGANVTGKVPLIVYNGA